MVVKENLHWFLCYVFPCYLNVYNVYALLLSKEEEILHDKMQSVSFALDLFFFNISLLKYLKRLL